MKEFPLSLQECFNLAYNGVISQGDTCSNDAGTCAYVGAQGRHCAAGHIFKVSNPELDLAAVDDSPNASAREVMTTLGYADRYTSSYSITDHTSLISDLQRAHDNAADWPDAERIERFQLGAFEIARFYGLSVPE